MPAIENLTVQI